MLTTHSSRPTDHSPLFTAHCSRFTVAVVVVVVVVVAVAVEVALAVAVACPWCHSHGDFRGHECNNMVNGMEIFPLISVSLLS